MSLHDVPPTRFGLGTAIIRVASNNKDRFCGDVHMWSQYTVFSITIVKNIENTDVNRVP